MKTFSFFLSLAMASCAIRSIPRIYESFGMTAAPVRSLEASARRQRMDDGWKDVALCAYQILEEACSAPGPRSPLTTVGIGGAEGLGLEKLIASSPSQRQGALGGGRARGWGSGWAKGLVGKFCI